MIFDLPPDLPNILIQFQREDGTWTEPETHNTRNVLDIPGVSEGIPFRWKSVP